MIVGETYFSLKFITIWYFNEKLTSNQVSQLKIEINVVASCSRVVVIMQMYATEITFVAFSIRCRGHHKI